MSRNNLSRVKRDLNNWRNSGRRGNKVPTKIRKETVELLNDLPRSEVLKELGINNQTLKTWEDSSEVEFVDLVEIANQPATLNLKLSLELESGQKLICEGNQSYSAWQKSLELMLSISQ